MRVKIPTGHGNWKWCDFQKESPLCRVDLQGSMLNFRGVKYLDVLVMFVRIQWLGSMGYNLLAKGGILEVEPTDPNHLLTSWDMQVQDGPPLAIS